MEISKQEVDRIAKVVQDTTLMLSATAAMRVLKMKHGFNEAQLNEFAKDHSEMIDLVHKEQQFNRDKMAKEAKGRRT